MNHKRGWRRIAVRLMPALLLLVTVLAGLALSVAYAPFPGPAEVKDRLAMFPRQSLHVEQGLTIRWNKHQIPFIEAASDSDAAYGVGLVHAHLRLGQMELARRIVYGRLSELAGPKANKVDHTLRILDFSKTSQAVYEAMPPDTRRWVERYIEGINDYIALMEEEPHEFRLLGLKREKWQPKDVFAIGRLGGTDYSWLIWEALIEYRGSPEWEEIWKTVLEAGSGQLYAGDVRRLAAEPYPERRENAPRFSREDARLEEDKTHLLEQFAKLGSNSVVVGPSRSASGAPQIANDPHLGLSLPNLWFVVGLKSPSYHVVGMMAPGLPVFAFGRNEHIAWGGTNLHAANSDLYDVSDLKPSEFEWREEVIKTRFWKDKKVRYRISPYGPVITDSPMIPDTGGRMIALKWVGHGMSDEITAMLRVNRARNWDEFQSAFRNFAVPSQNMLYADTDGNIGRLTATMLPFRLDRAPKDMFADRSQYEQSWGHVVNAGALPSQFIPREGYVVSANDPPPEGTVTVGYFFSPPDRALRLRQLIEQQPRVSLGELERLQRDVHSHSSLLLRDALLERMDRLGVHDGKVVELMRKWDGNYNADSEGALAFQVFISNYARELYRRMRRKDELKAIEKLAYFEDLLMARTEMAKDKVLKKSFLRALEKSGKVLETYHVWGDMHRLEVKHVLAGIPVIGRRYVFDNLPASGSKETVMKRAHGLVGDKPEGAFFGAQSRHLSDLSDPDANYFILLGGEDGWLNSSTFMDQLDLWQQGKYIRIPMRMENVAKAFPHAIALKAGE